MLYFLDLFGTAVFAISGVTLAFRLRMNVIGVLVLSAAVAIGGGTVRDIILNSPVFWLTNNTYLWDILLTCILSIIVLLRINKRIWWLLPVSDAIGLAAFTVIGTQKTLLLGFSPTIAIIMGAVTGCGGGVIRDVLARQVPFVFRKEIYVTASAVGGMFYVSFYGIFNDVILAILTMVIVLGLRLGGIFRNWTLPVYHY